MTRYALGREFPHKPLPDLRPYNRRFTHAGPANQQLGSDMLALMTKMSDGPLIFDRGGASRKLVIETLALNEMGV